MGARVLINETRYKWIYSEMLAAGIRTFKVLLGRDDFEACLAAGWREWETNGLLPAEPGALPRSRAGPSEDEVAKNTTPIVETGRVR